MDNDVTDLPAVDILDADGQQEATNELCEEIEAELGEGAEDEDTDE